MASWTIPSIYQYQILKSIKKKKKGMDRSNKKISKILYKCITANTSVCFVLCCSRRCCPVVRSVIVKRFEPKRDGAL